MKEVSGSECLTLTLSEIQVPMNEEANVYHCYVQSTTIYSSVFVYVCVCVCVPVCLFVCSACEYILLHPYGIGENYTPYRCVYTPTAHVLANAFSSDSWQSRLASSPVHASCNPSRKRGYLCIAVKAHVRIPDSNQPNI